MTHDTRITSETPAVPALAVEGPQPVWMTLDAARERAFTGEIVFETDPEVYAYLDNGTVYYAERASDVSLGRRLLRAGVVDRTQLESGTVRVGDIEHLGRLFDRDPSVDRDAVIVLAETTTQELITELANQSIAGVRLTAYRHHPSGVHRWFVAPSEPAPMTRPVSAVAQIDDTVLDELPALSFDDADVADLVIEWDDDIDDIREPHADVFELSPALIEFADFAEFTDAAVHTYVDTYVDDDVDIDADIYSDADVAVDTDTAADAEVAVDTDVDTDTDGAGGVDTVFVDPAPAPAAVTAPVRVDVEPVVEVSDAGESARHDYEFSVVWPDGSEESAIDTTAHVDEPTTSLDEPSGVDAVLAASDDGNLRFTMPPLELSDEPERADADVPDDVAEAVRRAIAAIESASVAVPGADSGHDSSVHARENGDVEFITEPPRAGVTGPVPMVQAPAGLGGFAPPTMAMHAEVLYAQMAAGGSAVVADDRAEDGSDSGNDRSSALRRLIGSLRRKDH